MHKIAFITTDSRAKRPTSLLGVDVAQITIIFPAAIIIGFLVSFIWLVHTKDTNGTKATTSCFLCPSK